MATPISAAMTFISMKRKSRSMISAIEAPTGLTTLTYSSLLGLLRRLGRWLPVLRWPSAGNVGRNLLRGPCLFLAVFAHHASPSIAELWPYHIRGDHGEAALWPGFAFTIPEGYRPLGITGGATIMSAKSESENGEPSRAVKAVVSVATVATILGIIGAVIALAATWLSASIETAMVPTPARFTISDRQALQEMRQELTLIKAEQTSARLRGQITPPLSALDARLAEVEKRQQQIDRVIMNDPDKALELPLMRRDLAAIDQRQSMSVEAVRRSVEQVYGLLAALLVAIVGLFVTTYARRKEQ